MRFACGTALILVCWAGTVRADDVEDARRHYSNGTKAFEIGAYDEAIREYSAAYRLKDDPALLFNLAQAHRLAGHSVEALREYRMFLLKVPDSPSRSEVEGHIRDLQHQVDSEKRATAPPPSASPPAQERAAAPVVSTQAAAGAPPNVDRGQSTAGRHTKLIAGGAVAAAGVAIAAVGIVFGVLAQRAGDDLTRAAQAGQPYDYGKQQAGTTDQVLEATFLSVGGAAVVTGAVLMLIGHREAKRGGLKASLQPRLGTSSFGLSLAGVF